MKRNICRSKRCLNCLYFVNESRWIFTFRPDGKEGSCSRRPADDGLHKRWVNGRDPACECYSPLKKPLLPSRDLYDWETDIGKKGEKRKC